MSKSYLKYEASHTGGVITSAAANYGDCIFLPQSQTPTMVVPSLEAVSLLSLRTGTSEGVLLPSEERTSRSANNEVTSLRTIRLGGAAANNRPGAARAAAAAADSLCILVGYGTGHAAVFRGTYASRERSVRWGCQLYAAGHKVDTAVFALAMEEGTGAATTMVTGGQDTDITVWDVSAQEALYRLRGHRGAVVSLELVSSRNGADNYVISGSADGLVKVWNLGVQQCIQTILASDTQVTALGMDLLKSRLFVGLRDDVIKVYDTEPLLEEGKDMPSHGVIQRKNNKPVTSFTFSDNGAWFAATTSHTTEVFSFNSAEDTKKKVQRKKKRARKEGDNTGAAAAGDDEEVQQTAAEEVTSMKLFRMEDKLKSARFVPGVKDRNSVHIVATYADNAIRSFTSSVVEADAATGATNSILSEPKTKFSIAHQGHREAIRQAHFTANDGYLFTVSHDAAKLWTTQPALSYSEREAALDEAYHDGMRPALPTLVCSGSHTIGESAKTSTNITCAAVAGNEIVCVGDASGKLHVMVLPSMDITATINAHVGGVTNVIVRNKGTGFASIGVDRRLVEWNLTLKKRGQQNDDDGDDLAEHGNSNGRSVVTIVQTREIELSESPTAVAYSEKLVGVALQDYNVQLFYADSLKPFVSLYGHKLPVTQIDFSDDGALVATGGMDKSLRFWGTDFGDCHRAIHAHDDYLTSVKFVPGTHFVFTCSLDGSIKHWDGDTWSIIQVIRIHQHGVWNVALSHDGTCIASVGIDRCMRLMQKTDEMIFPDEEEERMAQEAMDEEEARKAAMSKLDAAGTGGGDLVVGTVTSTNTANAAENLMEALDNVSVEIQRQESGSTTLPNPVLRNRTVWQYLWAVIEAIKPSELRHATESLTAVHINALITYLEKMIDVGAVLNYEIATKVLLSLVKPAPGSSSTSTILSIPEAQQHSGANSTLQLLRSLRQKLAAGLGKSRERFGFATAGLKFVGDRIEEKKSVKFFDVSKVQGAKRKFHSSAIPSKKQ